MRRLKAYPLVLKVIYAMRCLTDTDVCNSDIATTAGRLEATPVPGGV
jgi:hypothetical protein